MVFVVLTNMELFKKSLWQRFRASYRRDFDSLGNILHAALEVGIVRSDNFFNYTYLLNTQIDHPEKYILPSWNFRQFWQSSVEMYDHI